MKLFLLILCLISGSASALTKAEIKQSLDQMRTSGMFTEAQIKAAEKQLMEMDQKEIDGLVKQGKEKAKDPEFQKKLKDFSTNPKLKEQMDKAINNYKKGK